MNIVALMSKGPVQSFQQTDSEWSDLIQTQQPPGTARQQISPHISLLFLFYVTLYEKLLSRSQMEE